MCSPVPTVPHVPDERAMWTPCVPHVALGNEKPRRAGRGWHLVRVRGAKARYGDPVASAST